MASTSLHSAATGADNIDLWKAHSWRRFPFMIALSLFGACAGGGGAFLLLHFVNNQAVEQWRVSPTVYLSIIATMSNTFVRYAFVSGLDIFWWSRLLSMSGVTLRELNDIWQLGHDSTSLLQIPRSLFPVRSAGILVLLLAVNGPLLQRAITVETVLRTGVGIDILPIRVEPMWNLTTINIDATNGWEWSLPPYQPEFAALVSELNQQRVPRLSSPICPPNSTCTANVTVAGFSRNCSEDTMSIYGAKSLGRAQYIVFPREPDYWIASPCSRTSSNDSNISLIPSNSGADSTMCHTFKTYYQLALNTVDSPTPVINYTSYIRTDWQSDLLSVRRCNFTTAFLQIPIEITDGSAVAISSTEWFNNSRIETIPSAAKTSQDFIGGFTQILKDMYEGYMFYDTNEYATIAEGVGPRTYVNSSSLVPPPGIDRREGNMFSCLDPLDDFTNTLNDLSIRYAMKSIPTDPVRIRAYERYIAAATDYRSFGYPKIKTQLSSNQSVEVSTNMTVVVYKAHFVFTAIVMAVILLSTLTITALLPSWGRLGRQFSMSPLEIAKAFNAPLLSDVGSNMTATQISEEVGCTRVRYGEVDLSSEPVSAQENARQPHMAETQALITDKTATEETNRLQKGPRLMVEVADQVDTPQNNKAYI